MKISLVVPVFNEEETLHPFYEAVRHFPDFKEISVEILFVNDGSSDATESIIDELARSDELVTSIHFTRNFGKEAALFAGLERVTGDAAIPIDVDLQDPIEVIPKLIEKWQAGSDVVLAKRIDRSSDTLLKRMMAEWFYKTHNFLSKPRIEENVGDFRLMSRKVVEDVVKLHEKNLFMKGVLSWVGGRTAIVEYVRAKRDKGQSKFNSWKLWNLALEGITSFSTVPLRIWTYLGLAISFSAFLYASWLIFDKLFFGNDVPGYPSIMVSLLFMGGVQLIGIGVLGEYIGRIHSEVKNRPRYLIKKADDGQSI